MAKIPVIDAARLWTRWTRWTGRSIPVRGFGYVASIPVSFILRPLAGLCLVAGVLFLVGRPDLAAPARTHVAHLERELAEIAVPTWALPERADRTAKPRVALAGQTFTVRDPTLAYRDVRGFYDAELARTGWTFQSERPVTVWGEELGGRAASYCKGEYVATLEWAGDPSTGWAYRLGLLWSEDRVGICP